MGLSVRSSYNYTMSDNDQRGKGPQKGVKEATKERIKEKVHLKERIHLQMIVYKKTSIVLLPNKKILKLKFKMHMTAKKL